jgi:SH3 domain protein
MASRLVCIVVLLSASTTNAATLYISDALTVPLRSGPSSEHRILRVLPAGTALEVLDRDEAAGFVRVRTEGELEGWLPEQYLVAEPIARDRLVTANARIRELTGTVERLQRELNGVSTNRDEIGESHGALERQVAALQAELAEIRSISAGAIEQNEANKELRALNDRLRSEVDALVETIATLEADVEQRWLLVGGGLVLGGLILGIGIKSRPRRSAWS